jgi:cellulose biosynthesis protein BcsQ
MVKNQRAICKFQKADLIYKQILSVYSEKASSITGFKMNSDEGKVVLFCSPSGGVGTSTAAAACAMHMASTGKKTLYLNLEKYGSADLFFHGEGQFDMSDLIFALKSKKANLHLKLESCIKQDASGVYFYSQPKLALDMMELSMEEILRLLSEIQLMGEYAYIVIDADFSLTKDAMTLYRKAQDIVMVGDGSELSNSKIIRAYEALTIMEQNADAPLMNRMSFLYNKASSKTGQSVNIQGLRELGGAPKYERATTAQILAQLAPMELFNKIL